jgi:outer membrane murein-binding lipoprotein Lpp
MSIKPQINWLGITTFMLTMAGIVWAGSEKLADKADQAEVDRLGRRVQSGETAQDYLREDVKEIRQDVKDILKEVRRR